MAHRCQWRHLWSGRLALAQSHRSAFKAPRRASWPESKYCNDAPSGRVKHEFPNKDKGTIDGPGFVAEKGSRGAVGRNFERAVKAAIADTQDKWLILQERLRAAYGPVKGDLMICAITHDDPAKTCGAQSRERATSPFKLFSSIALLLGTLGAMGRVSFAARGWRGAPRAA